MFNITTFYDRYPFATRATAVEIAEYDARPEVIEDRAARAEIDKQNREWRRRTRAFARAERAAEQSGDCKFRCNCWDQ